MGLLYPCAAITDFIELRENFKSGRKKRERRKRIRFNVSTSTCSREYVPYVPGFRFGRSPILTSTLGITRFVAFMTKYDF